MSKVPVYTENPQDTLGAKVVGRVQYNNVLDKWNGSNMQYGGRGLHGGITKLRRTIEGKSFVFIFGTQYQGARDYGYLIHDVDALSLILESGDDELLKKYFPWYQDPEEEDFDLPAYRELAESNDRR